MRIVAVLFTLLSVAAARGDEPANVAKPAAATRAADQVELSRLKAEFAELRSKLDGEPQIVLHVRMFRLRLDALRQTGVDVRRGVLALTQSDPPAAGIDRPQHVDAAKLRPDDPLPTRLEAWSADPARLARPIGDTRLLSRPGKEALLKSGSEIALKLPQELGAVADEHIYHGTQFKATPEWLADGRVRLKLVARSSDIHDPRSTSIDGQPVPSLRTAVADLSVDLDPGEIFAACGLVQTEKSDGVAEDAQTLTLVSADLAGVDADLAKIEALRNLRGKLAEVRARLAAPQIAVRMRIYEVDAGTIARLQAEVEGQAAKRAASGDAPPPADAETLVNRFQTWLDASAGQFATASDTTLVVPSGCGAFVHSGGELPILVPQALGRVALEFRRYGKQLYVRPELSDAGVVRLEIHPRVALRDLARDITINGHRVPSILVYDLPLNANMAPGQTLIVGGLPPGFAPRSPHPPKPDEDEPPAVRRDLVMLLSVDTVQAARELVKTSAETPLGRPER
jgi:Flp pilus assembly secretin CpaC